MVSVDVNAPRKMLRKPPGGVAMDTDVEGGGGLEEAEVS